MRRFIPVLLLALVAAACGGSDEPEQVSSSDVLPSDPSADFTPAADSSVLDKVTVADPLTDGGDPVVTIDTPLDTSETVRRVLVEGDGEPAADEAMATFHLVAFNGTTGEKFDATRPGPPASLPLDPTSVIPGIYRSLIGVPAGSQVVAAISPADAAAIRGGLADVGISEGDSLVFVFDLISVSIPLERATGTAVEPAAGLPTVTLAEDGKPTIELPDSDPPDELISQVLIEGDGAVVEAGQQLTAHYTGIIWPGGEQFDSSWDRGAPSAFPIGSGGVISGWDETLVGQTIGSQLLLVIPPEDGYGTGGNANAGILGTDTLVFIVDILAAA